MMKHSLIILSLLALSSPLYASSGSSGSPDPSNPQQQVNLDKSVQDSCSDKEEGELCDIINAQGQTISGQCKRSGNADTSLHCLPNG